MVFKADKLSNHSEIRSKFTNLNSCLYFFFFFIAPLVRLLLLLNLHSLPPASLHWHMLSGIGGWAVTSASMATTKPQREHSFVRPFTFGLKRLSGFKEERANWEVEKQHFGKFCQHDINPICLTETPPPFDEQWQPDYCEKWLNFVYNAFGAWN